MIPHTGMIDGMGEPDLGLDIQIMADMRVRHIDDIARDSKIRELVRAAIIVKTSWEIDSSPHCAKEWIEELSNALEYFEGEK